MQGAHDPHLLTIVLAGFGAACVAPAIYRRTPQWSGWVLALVPAGIVAALASRAPSVWREGTLRGTVDWAPSLGLSLTFLLDGFSLLFAMLISGIGALVLIYAGGYLKGHPGLGRLYCLLLLFSASMTGLALAGNLLLLFLFWELTSIFSYLLIGFDSRREQARRSALQALLVTGVGGLALLAGFVLLAQVAGSYELEAIRARAGNFPGHPLTNPILVLVMVGAFAKSAQFPFHFWLPNAMQAPTPVSAYLHAATMVKAGVYLMARLTPVFSGLPLWADALMAAGAVTMLLGAWVALFKTDLKQILAYSTVSVLGILTFLCGIGAGYAMEAFVLYLLAHALYKGALFLVAGIVDHETGSRDLSRLGGLYRVMPLTAGAALLSALSMAGLPPLFGFIGKEMLYQAGLKAPGNAVLLTKILVVTAILLFAVAGSAGLRPFAGRRVEAPRIPHEAPVAMLLGPLALSLAGVVLGLFPHTLETAVRSAVAAIMAETAQDVHLAIFHGLNLGLLLSGISVAGGVILYSSQPRLRALVPAGRRLAQFGPERLYECGLEGTLRLADFQTRLLQSGYLRRYLLMFIAGAVLLCGYTLSTRVKLTLPGLLQDVHLHELMLGAAILAATLTAVRAGSRLTAVAAMGAIGACVSVFFALFGAPDLAMTQIVVEMLTVILLVLVLRHLPDFSSLTQRGGRLRDAMVALACGGLMAGLVLAAAASQHSPDVTSYYLENSLTLAGGRNVVNVILTDFRALDTLGEITVLAVAAIGVFALMRFGKEGSR